MLIAANLDDEIERMLTPEQWRGVQKFLADDVAGIDRKHRRSRQLDNRRKGNHGVMAQRENQGSILWAWRNAVKSSRRTAFPITNCTCRRSSFKTIPINWPSVKVTVFPSAVFPV
jgi:hypothetical protein